MKWKHFPRYWPFVRGIHRSPRIHLNPPDWIATVLADDIFKSIFSNENDRIPFPISLKFVPRSPIDDNPAWVHVMAWHRIGDRPLSEPMMLQFTHAYMRHEGNISFNQRWHCLLTCMFISRLRWVIKVGKRSLYQDDRSGVTVHFSVKIIGSGRRSFTNVASDWMAAVLSDHQMP